MDGNTNIAGAVLGELRLLRVQTITAMLTLPQHRRDDGQSRKDKPREGRSVRLLAWGQARGVNLWQALRRHDPFCPVSQGRDSFLI